MMVKKKIEKEDGEVICPVAQPVAGHDLGFKLSEYLGWVKSWGAHKGKTELIRHLEGETLSRAEAMTAYCFSCGAGYSDGAKDCKMYHCSMYPYMPYGTRKPKTGRSGRVLSDEHKAKMLAGRRAKE